MKKFIFKIVAFAALFFVAAAPFHSAIVLSANGEDEADEAHVAIMHMQMMILPGTAEYLNETIAKASADGAKLIVVHLDTPGGVLSTSQEMIQNIFKSPIPIAIYVSPTGGTATSAGVFITMAGHIAAMAPGTSIGAAHPVTGEGKDIEGDMRAKAENMTIAMVKSISEQRGRNVAWAEKAVKESNSITETEALKTNVVDVVAKDVDDLLKQVAGKQVSLESGKVTLQDFSSLPKRAYEMSVKDQFINVLSNPNIAALLWLGATTGLSLELYNPGAILPGVVGIICLVLALAVSQVIPMNHGAILLLVVGAGLIGAEFYVPSGLLGIGGILAMVLGALYLIDASAAPGLGVDPTLILPIASLIGLAMLYVVFAIIKVKKRPVTTGMQGLVGQKGKAIDSFTSKGKVFVNGEVWNATSAAGIIDKDSSIEVVAVKDGLMLEVRPG